MVLRAAIAATVVAYPYQIVVRLVIVPPKHYAAWPTIQRSKVQRRATYRVAVIKHPRRFSDPYLKVPEMDKPRMLYKIFRCKQILHRGMCRYEGKQ